MQVHTSLPGKRVLDSCALSVGTFDGVHRGHQLLINELKTRARGLPTAVLTFQDMPYCYFRPDDCPRLLTLLDEKVEAFSRLLIDHLFVVPFDAAIASTPYDDFVREVLLGKFGLELLVVGPDFALGKNRAGNVEALSVLGETSGFKVQVLAEKLEDTGAPISSTRVRRAVENGAVEDAARMLGRSFSFEGEVVAGKQLGRTIGMPTINLKIHSRKVLPKNGVYAARAFFDGSHHAAALSVGTNPTTDSDDKIKVEFHVLDENIVVPPKAARVQIVARLRDERKFVSLEALIEAMRNDVQKARDILQ